MPPAVVGMPPAPVAPMGPMGEAGTPTEGTAPPTAGPVVNRMSHFTLFQYDRSATTTRTNFRYQPGAILASLIGGGAPGGGQGPP